MLDTGRQKVGLTMCEPDIIRVWVDPSLPHVDHSSLSEDNRRFLEQEQKNKEST